MGQELHLVIPESTMTKNNLPQFTGQSHKPSIPNIQKETKTSVSRKQRTTQPLLCRNSDSPQKALTIYRENEKQLDNHVITLCYLKAGQERKKQILVCSLMNRNSWLTTELENSPLFTAVIHSVWYESHPTSPSHSPKWA